MACLVQGRSLKPLDTVRDAPILMAGVCCRVGVGMPVREASPRLRWQAILKQLHDSEVP